MSLLEVPSLEKHLAWFAMPEFILILLVVGVMLLSLGGNWHRKSIEYRLLSELFRKQKTLATLGWALPIGGVEHLADREWLSWVAWLLAAMQRASPFPQCEVDDAGMSQLRVDELNELLEEQIDYHEKREMESKAASERLELVGGTLFLLLAVLALMKIGFFAMQFGERSYALKLIEFLGVLLPSISAASLALRSYAELDLLAEQSRSVKADLQRAQARVKRIDLTRPLASQSIGEEAGAVAAIMLQDLEGWGRIFRGKLLELS